MAAEFVTRTGHHPVVPRSAHRAAADAPPSCRSRVSRAGASRATWTGVRIADLRRLVGAPPGAPVRVDLAGTPGAYRTSTLPGPIPRPGHAAGAAAQRRAARARPRLPLPGSSRPAGPASCRPSGSTAWRCSDGPPAPRPRRAGAARLRRRPRLGLRHLPDGQRRAGRSPGSSVGRSSTTGSSRRSSGSSGSLLARFVPAAVACAGRGRARADRRAHAARDCRCCGGRSALSPTLACTIATTGGDRRSGWPARRSSGMTCRLRFDRGT